MLKLSFALFLLILTLNFVQPAPEKDKNNNRECWKCLGDGCKGKSFDKTQCGNASCMKRIIKGVVERGCLNDRHTGERLTSLHDQCNIHDGITECYCNKDLCNESSRPVLNYLFLITLAILTTRF